MDSAVEPLKRLNTTPEAHSNFSLFDLLPSEILILILSFAVHLTEYDTSPNQENASHHRIRFPYTALRVSKRWHEVAMTTPDMWTVVSIRIYGHTYPSAAGRRVNLHWERSGKRPMHLHIDSTEFASYEFSSVLRARLVEEGKQWKSLHLVGRRFSIIELLYHLFEPMNTVGAITTINELQITHTGLQEPNFYDEQARTVALGGAFFNLQHIHLCRYSQSLFPLPRLQSLCMDEVHPSALAILSRTHLPALTTLAIHCAPHITSDHERVANSSTNQSFDRPNLRSAILYNVRDLNVKKILSGAQNLENLAISSVDPDWDLQYLTYTAMAPRMSGLTIHNPSSFNIRLREVIESRLSCITRITMDNEALTEAGGVRDTMGWMEDHVEVKLVPTVELSFTRLASQILPQTQHRPVWSSNLCPYTI